jgi:flagellar L-ring protein precursor FlgH
MTKRMIPMIVTGLAMAVAQRALGQAVPDARAQNREDDRPQPTKLQSTQMLMQNNGGSLLQASGTPRTPVDPLAKPEAIGLMEVAEPIPHVLKKHDLVNIVVQEASKSASSGLSDQERQVDFDAKVDAFVKLNLAKLSVQGGAEGANPPEVKLEGQRDFKGTGEYDRSDTVSLRLEAEVIDVKPNGRLLIQARRHIKTDEEDIAVSLTGECRVADLDLEKVTKGEVTATTKRGLIHRLLDFINPF